MNKKELKKDKLVFVLSIFSLIIISLIIGDFFKSFFIVLFSILVVSLIYSLIEHKKDLLNNFKKHSYVLLFSLLTTLIFSVLWAYVSLPDKILGTFTLQYIYLTPILLLFFFSSYWFQNLLSKKKFSNQHIIKHVLLDVAIVSIIISLTILFSFNSISNSQAESYEQSFMETIVQFQEIENPNNLEILEDIKLYQQDFLEEANNQKWELDQLTQQTNFFSVDKKTEIIVDKALHMMELVIPMYTIESRLEQMDEQYIYINSEEFDQNYTSLEEYDSFLLDGINNSNFAITYLSEEKQEIIDLLNSELSYSDLVNIGDLISKDDSLGSCSFVIWEFNDESLFFNSLNYVFEHSFVKKEIDRLVINALIYTHHQGTNNDLFTYLYESRGKVESLSSQVLRNYGIYRFVK